MSKHARLKIAFATGDLKHVDQHFGSSSGFAIYVVNEEGGTLVEAVRFGQLAQDGNEEKLAPKIAALTGCDAVFFRAAGASALKQLLAAGIHPVKIGEEDDIARFISALQAELREGPISWLAQALARQKTPLKSTERFSQMEAEGWDG